MSDQAIRRPLILLVEDNPAEAFLFRQTLDPGQLDADLHVSEDGDEAIDFLRKKSSGPAVQPDLILLDYNLPRSTGAELFTRIRVESSDSSIAFLSGSESPADYSEMEALGPAAIMPKPRTLAEFQELWDRIAVLLSDGQR